MYQDIQPHSYHSEFLPRAPREGDCFLVFREGKVYLLSRGKGDSPELPDRAAIREYASRTVEEATYLFSIDDTAFYLAEAVLPEAAGFTLHDVSVFRGFQPGWLGFAGATGFHLAGWYDRHRYCGRCGQNMTPSGKERALRCPACNLTVYPRISPAVIVGVTAGDKLLLTRYTGRAYNRYSLIAGFTEIGETIEDTVQRETMEEVGLRVKNIRYYASQPWAFSESVLMGFFCELDGGADITLDKTELAEAVWFRREEIPPADSLMSLTWTMIEAFRTGKFTPSF